jgi:hypothetical protein
MRGFSPLMLSSHSNSYSTVTGAESRMRLAFDAVFRKSATLQDVEPTQGSTSALPDAPMDPQLGPRLLISGVDTPMASMATLTIPGTPSGLKKVTLVSYILSFGFGEFVDYFDLFGIQLLTEKEKRKVNHKK